MYHIRDKPICTNISTTLNINILQQYDSKNKTLGESDEK